MHQRKEVGLFARLVGWMDFGEIEQMEKTVAILPDFGGT